MSRLGQVDVEIILQDFCELLSHVDGYSPLHDDMMQEVEEIVEETYDKVRVLAEKFKKLKGLKDE